MEAIGVADLVNKSFVSRMECLEILESGVDCYFTHNGHKADPQSDEYSPDASFQVRLRLRGGKGGFGSMLRAIGNQIEKTTNNDMCRDLSGRRIRDVNAEAKLKEWYAKASERERQKAERYLEKQRRRREALEKGPLHDHKFNDTAFFRTKEKISADLQDALAEMLKNVIAEAGPSKPDPPKRRKLWLEKLDEGNDSDSSDDSDDDSSDFNDDEENESPKAGPSHGPSSETQINEEPASSSSSPPDVDKSGKEVVENSGDQEESKEESTKKEQSAVEEDKPTPPTASDADEMTTTKRKAEVVVEITEEMLSSTSTAADLESYGLESLKQALAARGLKCGGTLKERATRLFAVKGLSPDAYPAKLRAKPSANK